MADARIVSAAELRRAFDKSFAEPERRGGEASERFLAIAIAGIPYALRLSELLVLAAARKIVPLPDARAELLGLTGHRGTLVPVFDLGALLGHEPIAQPRWLVLCGARDPVGLAFGELEEQIEIAPSAVSPLAPGRERRHVAAVLEGAPARAVIDVASVLAVISQVEP
ncbi:MAG: chemotaxis protein CheW [Labilithrix sp.]|nr:chemotaxis protein CheW [Labilithrix sp.]